MPFLLAALLALFPLAPALPPTQITVPSTLNTQVEQTSTQTAPAGMPNEPCPKAGWGTPAIPQPNASSWVVADMNTGEVLAACNPNDQYAPASVIKLLTALAVQPKLDPNQSVDVTYEDLMMDPASSRMGLVPWGKYSAETLLLGLFLNSGNDAAQTLARAAGGQGGMPGTINEMNALAAKIGATNTHVENPHGLDAPGQVTTAYDLAVIAKEVFKNDKLAQYLRTTEAWVPEQPTYHGFQIQNDNQLLYNYEGALGGKTGYTNEAQHSYVGAAQRGNRKLVVTILHGQRTPAPLWNQSMALLDWGFSLPEGTQSIGTLNQ
ncbi:MAG: D-alanyl-D-alanine carboxypeptidase [Corynebacteriales bacterium]|nr:D-alanyl-D-alanine carboxypeptidase [Mycobacteriales bacterium]